MVGERADAASFSTLIELCGAQGQLDTALQLIGYVQRLGMQRTVKSMRRLGVGRANGHGGAATVGSSGCA